MANNLPLISVNGVLDAAISPLDRGFSYGDGIFETCRIHRGKIPLWEYHLDRLEQSAHRLNISLDTAQLTQYRDALLQKIESTLVTDAVIKIILTRGVGGRGYRQPDCAEPTYCLGVFPGNALQSVAFNEGVSVRVCDARLSINPSLAGIKHLNRLEHILARAEWQDEFAEGLLLDQQERVIEATVSNLFVAKNGSLYTPDLFNAGVAGVMRRCILERFAPTLGIATQITEMKLDFVANADEIFLCNSVFGIWPVKYLFVGQQLLEKTDIHFQQDSVTQKLQQQLLALF